MVCCAGVSQPDRIDVLLQDCREAMVFCLEGPRNFYKPRYHLAQLYLAQQQPKVALAQLRPLFTSAKLVKLKLSEIDDAADAKVRPIDSSVCLHDCSS